MCLVSDILLLALLQDDIGLSSVVGSAIFNIMFVISLCALFAGSVSEFLFILIECQYVLVQFFLCLMIKIAALKSDNWMVLVLVM